jgi:polyisoprenoid-binding protein YceI
MKKLLYLLSSVLLIFLFFSCGNSDSPTKNDSLTNSSVDSVLKSANYVIDSSNYVIWRARHMKDTTDDYVSKLYIKDGKIEVLNDKIVGGTISINLASMKMDDQLPGNLIKHLTSTGYFNLASFPFIDYTITNFKNDSCFGELSVIGVNQQINFPLEVLISDESIQAKGTILIDMLPFNMPDLLKTHSKENRDEIKGPNNFIYLDMDITAYKS